MKAKKFLSILLAVLMLVAAFTACGGKEDKNSSSAADSTKSSKTESSAPEASDAGEGPEEAAEITIMMDGDNTPNATNLVLDKLGEMTNTKINMIYTPTDDKTQHNGSVRHPAGYVPRHKCSDRGTGIRRRRPYLQSGRS